MMNAGQEPFKQINISGDSGGYANGDTWDSNNLLDKINVILYLDPSKMSDVEKFLSILDKEKFDNQKVTITYIINTDATPTPNFMIKSKIKKKSKNNKNISYILDNERILIQQWGLIENSANVIILNKLNQKLYYCSSIMDDNQIEIALNIIKNEIKQDEIQSIIGIK